MYTRHTTHTCNRHGTPNLTSHPPRPMPSHSIAHPHSLSLPPLTPPQPTSQKVYTPPKNSTNTQAQAPTQSPPLPPPPKFNLNFVGPVPPPPAPEAGVAAPDPVPDNPVSPSPNALPNREADPSLLPLPLFPSVPLRPAGPRAEAWVRDSLRRRECASSYVFVAVSFMCEAVIERWKKGQDKPR